MTNFYILIGWNYSQMLGVIRMAATAETLTAFGLTKAAVV